MSSDPTPRTPSSCLPSIILSLAFAAALAVAEAPALAQPVRPPTSRPDPPAPPEQTALLAAKMAAATDGKKADEERYKAAGEAIEILSNLIRQYPREPRVHQWRGDKISLLIDAFIEPCSKRIIYEIATPADRDRQQGPLDEVAAMLPQAVEQVLAQLEVLTGPAYEKMEPLSNQLTYQTTLVQFYQAQFAWSRGVTVSDPGKGAALAEASAAVNSFFTPFAADADANRKLLAITFLGWTALFSGQADAAVTHADTLMGDPKSGPIMKFEASALKIQALRSMGSYASLGVTAPKTVEAALDEQSALLTREAGLKDPRWRVFNLLSRANTSVRVAAIQCRARMQQASDLEKKKQMAEARQLREKAHAEYQAAREKAIQGLTAAAAKDTEAAAMLDAVTGIVYRDPVYDAPDTATTQPSVLPSAKALADMPGYRLKQLADGYYRSQQYDNAAVCYSEMLSPKRGSAAAAQKGELLLALGHSYYFGGLNAEKVRNADFKKRFAAAEGCFGQLLQSSFSASNKADILKFQWSSILKQGDAFANPGKRKRTIAVLEQLLVVLDGPEREEARLHMARACSHEGQFRRAITEWNQIPATSPYYDKARENICWAILKLYAAKPTGIDRQIVYDDLRLLAGYADLTRKRTAAIIATQPDLDTWSRQPTTTAPDPAQNPVAWQRYLGASFKLEAGRLYCFALEDKLQAIEVIDAVPGEYPDLTVIRDRARSYRIQVFLLQKQFARATDDLLEMVNANVKEAEPMIDEVFGLYEKEYHRRLVTGETAEAKAHAEQAEQFARSLVEQARNNKQLPEKLLDDFLVRWARTLNWAGRSQEVVDVLAPKYMPRPTGAIDVNKTKFTRDADLIIELADAYLALKNYTEARDIYDVVVHKPGDMLPPLREYSEIWWRALIGHNECFLKLNQMVKGAYASLDQYSKIAEQLDAERALSDPDPRMPPWLKPRFDSVMDELKARPDVQKAIERASSRPDKKDQAPEIAQTRSFRPLLILGGGGIVGMFVVAYLSRRRLRRQQREEAMFQSLTKGKGGAAARPKRGASNAP